MQRITGDGVRAPRPTEGNKGAAVRADVGIGPYGMITGNAAIKAKQAADPWWASRLFF